MTYYLVNWKFPISTTTVENLKWLGQELAELWKGHSNLEKEYALTLPLTTNVKVTFKVTWYFICPQSHIVYVDHSDQIVAQSNEK